MQFWIPVVVHAGMIVRRAVVSCSGEEPPPAQPPPSPPKGALLRTEVLLGPECGNMSADVLPQLKLEQSWKPGRFMRDITHPASLVLQLPIERCCSVPSWRIAC